jgi:hypothetical protein
LAGTAGDSVLGIFDSVVDAMACARRLQEELAAAPAAGSDVIRTRIGMHLGDVIVDGDTVFGDGVNIARRLEQLADPGGILVSEAVYQQVRSYVDLPFESMGSRPLKNIAEPIRLFRVPASAFGPDASPPVAGPDDPLPPTSVADSADAIRDVVREATALARELIAEKRREATESPEDVDAAGGPGGRSAARKARALEARARKQRALERRLKARPDPPKSAGRRVLVSLLAFGNLVALALGVLLVVAHTSGYWSNAGAAFFLGSLFIGLAVGRMVAGAARWPAAGSVAVALGMAVGGFGFGHPVARAIVWVIAAGLIGRVAQRAVGD